MLVVLDTNVLIAALISPQGPPDQIYRAWRAGRFELVTADIQLEELRRVSRYPKLKAILPPHRIGAMINNLNRAIRLNQLSALPEGIESDDPDDNFLLSLALDSHADFVVTGDRRAGLLERGHIGRARILTPASFCACL